MTGQDPADVAWRVHGALGDWNGKVDSKASFALTIESAVVAGVVTLSTNGRPLDLLDGSSLWLFRGGLAFLIASIACAMWVVRPRLRAMRDLKREATNNFIYFGHLRLLDPEQIQGQLEKADVLPVLAMQIANISQIAWVKYRLVQASLTLAPIGAALIFLAGWLN